MYAITFVLTVASAILLYLWFNTKKQHDDLKQKTQQIEFNYKTASSKLQQAENSHKIALLALEKRLQAEMINQAGAQFQRWRDEECEKIRQQQAEIAKREAVTLLDEWKFKAETTIRTDAINRSQSVIVGKVTEHLIPYLPGFDYNPKDVRFFGDPIDLIVFDGLNDGWVKEIIFIEVKTGKSSRLSAKQQDIRDAIKNRPVRWATMRVSRDAKPGESPITIDSFEMAEARF